MSSEHVRVLLSPYIDDRLAPDERERVATHLADCGPCRAELEALRQVVGLLHSVPPVPAPGALRAAIRSRIERDWRAPWRRWIDRVPAISPASITGRWRPVTAAIVVAAIGISLWNVAGPRATRPDQALREVRDVSLMQPNAGASRGARSRSMGGTAATELNQKDASPPAGASSAPVGFGRSVIRTARVAVEVEQYDAAVRRLLDIAEGAGGFIADSSYSEVEGRPQGEFTLRVPAGQFAAAIKEVEAAGVVRQRQISAQDVTEEFVDLDARRRNLERHEQQLLSFMDRATKVTDLLALEQELSRVRGQIEQIAGRMRYLSHNVEMASITVALSERAKAVKPQGLWDLGGTISRIERAFITGVQQVFTVAERVLVLGATLLPFAAVALVSWVVFRRTRRAGARA